MRDIVNNLKDAGRWVLGLVGTIVAYTTALAVGLFLCYGFLMKLGSVINDTSMLQEARTTNIYDSIRRVSRAEDKQLAKDIYENRIATGYYETRK